MFLVTQLMLHVNKITLTSLIVYIFIYICVNRTGLGTGSFGEFFIVILQIQKYGFPPVNTKKLYNFSMQTRRGLGKH